MRLFHYLFYTIDSTSLNLLPSFLVLIGKKPVPGDHELKLKIDKGNTSGSVSYIDKALKL